ncbi:MAG: hypothetical protein H6869_08440 [Rhodospirillales bacterium]|nr:hypothetical protein [Rhodospirillales bacterium]
MIGGAVFYAKKEPAQPEYVHLETDHLVVDAVYQACAEGDRCIVVDSHCGFCCQYTTINARYEKEYDAAFDKNCGKYTGSICRCSDLSTYPSCVEGRCQLIKWPDAN